jgi:hypothetical protein
MARDHPIPPSRERNDPLSGNAVSKWTDHLLEALADRAQVAKVKRACQHAALDDGLQVLESPRATLTKPAMNALTM